MQGSYQITTATGGNVQGRTGHIDERLITNQVATLIAGGSATLVAQGDVSLAGVNLSAAGDAYVQGANVSVDAAKDRQAIDVQNVGAQRYNAAASVDETLAGGRISAGNNLSLVATGKLGLDGNAVIGTGNLSLTGAALTAGATAGAAGRAVLVANNDVTVRNTTTEHNTSSASFDARSDWWGSSTDSASNASHTVQVESATISAGSLSIQAGTRTTGNVLIQGSQVVATREVSISAANDLSLTAAQQTSAMQSSASSRKSGLFAGDDSTSVTIGSQQQSQTGAVATTTSVGSQVGSLSGNVSLVAGETYRQSGSQVLALAQGAESNGAAGTSAQAGDISITAKRVDIDAAATTQTSASEQSFHQSGLTLAVSNPLIAALQTVQQMAAAASKTQGDARLQALAAATAVFAGVQAAQSLADGSATSIGINISAGVSTSSSDSHESARNVVGSAVKAARDLTITATEGDLTAVGANLEGGRNTALAATGALNLQAAAQTADQHATNRSAGGSVGVGFTVGSQNGFTINANANAGLGNQGGTDVTQANTSVKAGATATLVSGGDTTFKGAVVAANRVVLQTGGNLNIESLQDTSLFDAKQVNAGVGVSLCLPPICYGPSSASGNFGNAKAVGNFASVTEQSGIKAGDGGFQVGVAGNTDLKGGVVSSTQAAIDAGKNSFTTATLTTSDIENHDTYQASAIAVSGSVSGQLGDQSSPKAQEGMTEAQKNAASKKSPAPTGSAGIGFTSGSQSSVTVSGISAGAIAITDSAAQQKTGTDAAATLAKLDTGVATDKDASASLTKTWNGQQMIEKVQASAQITAAFGATASKAVGDYAASQTQPYRAAQTYQDLSGQRADTLTPEQARVLDQLNASGMTPASAQAMLDDPQVKASYDNWTEGGAGRSGLHALIGGLTGGLAGAVGAGASALAAPSLNELQNSLQDGLMQAGMSPSAAKGLAQVAGTTAASAIGAVVGGSSGAATAFNEDLNNRQLHPQEIYWIGKNANKFAKELSTELGRPVTDLEAMQWLTSAGESDVDAAMQRSNSNFVRGTGSTQEAQAYDAAKAFIAMQAKGSFADESGQSQQLFTAKNGDFYKPEIYSQYANNQDYRDYFWSVQGLNLKPDKPTPQEKAIYDQRQAQVDAATVKQLIMAGVSMVGTAAAVKASNLGFSAVKTSASEFTPDPAKPVGTVKVDGKFEPLGLHQNPLDFPDGVAMVSQLVRTGMSRQEAVDAAASFIQTGSTPPIATPLNVSDKLVKVVPSGGAPSSSTGYWMRGSELSALQVDPATTANKLGLPPGMQVNSFDVYQILPKQDVVVFESTIAPTTVGGVANTTGGAKQSIVLDRTQFTAPVKTGTIVVKKGG